MTQPAVTPLAKQKSITILGATGTIGQNTLTLLEDEQEQFAVHTLTARQNAQSLAELAIKHNAERVIIEDEEQLPALNDALSGQNISIEAGTAAIASAGHDADVVISGIVGAAALPPTLNAIKQGATIGLANKECLVCAGDVLMPLVAQHGATIIPIDSEHNALFQCLHEGQNKQIEKMTLTASGGPFREWSTEQMTNVTPQQAVSHPNWSMGAKISVDSATMFNKGLELIEAHHLFDLPSEQLDIVVHPESIIHGLVHYNDGSVLAGMSIPDMRIPIATALHWPARQTANTPRLNLTELATLHFEAPDEQRFPALRLARASLEAGGNAPAILNAANEVAVDYFLRGSLPFLAIADCVEMTLEALENKPLTSIDEVLDIDKQARYVTRDLITRHYE